jgi:hypothetical protein
MVVALAIELVDKSDDRHVAQAVDEELAGLLLDAPLLLWGAASSTITTSTPSRTEFALPGQAARLALHARMGRCPNYSEAHISAHDLDNLYR